MQLINWRGIRVVLADDRDAPIEIGVAKQEVKMSHKVAATKSAT